MQAQVKNELFDGRQIRMEGKDLGLVVGNIAEGETKTSDNENLNHTMLRVKTKIGQGGFGKVYRVENENGEDLALKTCHCADRRTLDLVRQEIEILRLFLKNNSDAASGSGEESRVIQLLRYEIVEEAISEDSKARRVQCTAPVGNGIKGPGSDCSAPCVGLLLMKFAEGGSLKSYL